MDQHLKSGNTADIMIIIEYLKYSRILIQVLKLKINNFAP